MRPNITIAIPTPYLPIDEYCRIPEGEVIKHSGFELVERQAAALIVRRDHVFTGVDNPAVLAVQVYKLRQRQAVNRLGVVIGGVVVPDFPVIGSGCQYWFRLAEADNAHFF